MISSIELGARRDDRGDHRFLLWAPLAQRVDLRLHGAGERRLPMRPREGGYHEIAVPGLRPGMDYTYLLDGSKERPDPASRWQPEGVHGPSRLFDPDYPWGDSGWRGIPLAESVFYELHVGTYTAEGTFEAIIPHLPALRDLGINTIELMPVAQFPGSRNWGYDGTYPFAAQDSYGGPDGLRALVDACHLAGLAVVLDVVYNHLGPEGNYLRDFGPYFSPRYRTPWGEAINFDGPASDEVRRFFIESALSWIVDFHFDGLRLDALHAIFDQTAFPFLAELAESVHARAEAAGRMVHLIAESDLNDTRLVRPRREKGFELDAQWNDDFHHALHTLLVSERGGYYADFGKVGDLAKALTEGFVLAGQRSIYRRRRHGESSRGIPAEKMIVFSQNHDQVGNRRRGDRLSRLLPADQLGLAAVAVLLAPQLPLLFMGEEYGETAPFLYFVSHSDRALIEAVREGRKREFASFAWGEEVPDPQEEGTFLESKLDHRLREAPGHRDLHRLYAGLIELRRGHPALSEGSGVAAIPFEEERALFVLRSRGPEALFIVLGFGERHAELILPVPDGSWRLLEGSAGTRKEDLHAVGGIRFRLEPRSFGVYGRVPDERERSDV